MPRPDRKLTPRDIYELMRKIPGRDTIAEQHNLPERRGTIEEIEERHFPWLKARRQRRR